MKFDIVMWTHESASTLEQSLSSIENALPSSRICHKIIVDGRSKDSTEKIVRRYGWDFYTTTASIPIQANFALRLVDTDTYASFEHDIVLTQNWLPKIEALLGPPDVAIAQGVRLSNGSRPLDSLEQWSYRHGKIGKGFYSIDNTMYKTDIIRGIGGYPKDCPMTVDGFLRRRILARGMRWVTDPGCVSWHLRPSFPKYLQHVIRHLQNSTFLWLPEKPHHLTADLARRFFTSPAVATRIANETHTPSILLDYPLLRYVLLLTMSVLAREKQIISMPELVDEALKA